MEQKNKKQKKSSALLYLAWLWFAILPSCTVTPPASVRLLYCGPFISFNRFPSSHFTIWFPELIIFKLSVMAEVEAFVNTMFNVFVMWFVGWRTSCCRKVRICHVSVKQVVWTWAGNWMQLSTKRLLRKRTEKIIRQGKVSHGVARQKKPKKY